MDKVLVIGCGKDIYDNFEYYNDTMHTLKTWAYSLAKNYDTMWIGHETLESALSFKNTGMLSFDFNNFDFILMDSWVDYSYKNIWDAILHSYDGKVGGYIHYPHFLNIENVIDEDLKRYVEILDRYDIVFQPDNISMEYMELFGHAKCYPDIIWPVPTEVLRKQAGNSNNRKEHLATVIHCLDNERLAFRMLSSIKLLEEMGFMVDITTKNDDRMNEYNNLLSSIFNKSRCIGWLGDKYGIFLSKCFIMYELPCFASVSASICKAVASGIPCVSGKHMFQHILYPDLEISTTDGAREIIGRLIDDRVFYNNQVEKATEIMEQHNISHTARYMYEILETL